MINLRYKYSQQHLDNIATEWCNDVKTFLTEEHKGRHSLYILNGKTKKTFRTQLGKGIYILKNNSLFKSLSKNDKLYICNTIKDFVRNPEQYITAEEKRLETVKNELDCRKKVVSVIKKTFVTWYSDFTSNEEIAYKYMSKLDIRTCPYCNRNYTFTIKRTKAHRFKTRPEFDHFYDKSEYPSLALSFYNLVPSCHTCNHGKLIGEAKINPYFTGFHSKFYVCHYEGDKDKKQGYFNPMNVNEALNIKCADDFSLALPFANSDEETNIDLFGLNKLYNEHKDYVLEMIDKANAYNSIGAQNIVDAFQGIGHSPQEVIDFVWGKNLSEREMINRPLSKLTADILNQLGIK